MKSSLLLLALLVSLGVLFLFHPWFFNRPLSAGKRFFLFLLQLSPLLLICWLLADPLGEKTVRENKEQILAVLVDDSPSMGYEDGHTGTSRLERLKDWVHSLKSSPPAKGRIEVHFLSSLIPQGRSGSDFSEAFKGLRRVVANNLLSAVLFVSDGRDHSESSPIEAAVSLKVPVHTVGIGPETPLDRVRARWLEVPKEAPPGAPFLVRSVLEFVLDAPLPAEISVDLDSVESATRLLILPAGPNRHEEWFSVSGEEPGSHLLRLTVRNRDTGETVAVADATVTITEKPGTLLILETSPTRIMRDLTQAALSSGRWRVFRPVGLPDGSGVLWDLFRPDPGSTKKEAPWKKIRMHRPPPSEWRDLLTQILPETDVIAIGNQAWDRTPPGWRDQIGTHLNDNPGGVLVIPGAGSDWTGTEGSSLSRLLKWESRRRWVNTPLRLDIPEKMKHHPALAPVWAFLHKDWEIGPDGVFSEIPPLSEVLVQTSSRKPLVYAVPFGGGRAILVSTTALSSLHSAASHGHETLDFYHGLLLGFLDYLGGKPPETTSIVIEPERPCVGQSVEILITDPTLRPGPPVAGLEIRSGSAEWKTLLVDPDPQMRGLGRTFWLPRKPGGYEIRYAGATVETRVEVSLRPPETDEETADFAFLRKLAAETGGRYVPFEERTTLMESIDLGTVTLTHTKREPLRHTFGMGTLVAALFCCGWGLRRLFSLP